jgi:hypothetical protein
MTVLMNIFAWFMGTKVGRTVAMVAAGAVTIGIVLLKVFGAGKAAERVKQDRASLDNLRERAKTDAELDGLGSGDLDRRGRRWVRDE